MQVLHIANQHGLGNWLAEAFLADSASDVRLSKAVGTAAGLARLRHDVFDAILISHQPGDLDALETVEDEQWYQNLGPAQKVVVDQIVDRLLATDGSDLRINYSIDKSLADPWNMLAGANIDFNKRWTIRGEVGFIGRTSLLLSAVYRLDL